MRKPIIAGNWKMHNTLFESGEMLKELLPLVNKSSVEVIICPNYTSLTEIFKLLKGSNIKLGAQNMHYEEKGAYTGEVSPVFLKEIGVDYIILGHSERRKIFGEIDVIINKKIKAALKHNLSPILCVGETLEEREKDITYEIIKKQIEYCLEGLKDTNLDKLVVAYEPVWAIGTGKTATKEDANDVISFIRRLLSEYINKKMADKTRILYGGSVKPNNIKELMEMGEIDGALVGGASLKANDFAKIINY
ncbi:MAG: triose-phosphate isomerase [Firmicutes bacterium]|nr:triose-phosphate isomerase [Bacillota bacterium]